MDGTIDKKHVDMSNKFKMSPLRLCIKNERITFAKIVDYLTSNRKKGHTMIEKKKS